PNVPHLYSTLRPPTYSPLTITPISLHLFFFNHPPTTDIYPLSLHDALPISREPLVLGQPRSPISSRNDFTSRATRRTKSFLEEIDRKSTRLNSSHVAISYAVFCLKKKKNKKKQKDEPERK